MTLPEVILLGVIQGATEFLPISSSAHLVIFQNIFGVKQPQLFLDVALHIGTLVSTIIVLREEILALIKGAAFYVIYQLSGQKRKLSDEHKTMARLSGLVCIALVPTGIAGFFFGDQFERIFDSLPAIGIMLVLTGFILWMTRTAQKGIKESGTISIADALVIGIIQGLAIAPGISRSGATISFGLFRKLQKGFAFHFSFLISIPAIIGAMILEWEAPVPASGELLQVMAGALTSAVVGYLCLRVLRNAVQKGHLHVFSPYCWAVGSATVVLSLMLG